MMRARLTPRRGTTPSMASRKAVPPLRAIGRECEGTDLIAGGVDDAQLPLAVVPELAAAVSQHRAREHDGFGAGLLDVCQHGTFAVDRLDAIDDVEEVAGRAAFRLLQAGAHVSLSRRRPRRPVSDNIDHSPIRGRAARKFVCSLLNDMAN